MRWQAGKCAAAHVLAWLLAGPVMSGKPCLTEGSESAELFEKYVYNPDLSYNRFLLSGICVAHTSDLRMLEGRAFNY